MRLRHLDTNTEQGPWVLPPPPPAELRDTSPRGHLHVCGDVLRACVAAAGGCFNIHVSGIHRRASVHLPPHPRLRLPPPPTARRLPSAAGKVASGSAWLLQVPRTRWGSPSSYRLEHNPSPDQARSPRPFTCPPAPLASLPGGRSSPGPSLFCRHQQGGLAGVCVYLRE